MVADGGSVSEFENFQISVKVNEILERGSGVKERKGKEEMRKKGYLY